MSRRLLFSLLSRVTSTVAIDTDGLRLYLSTADLGVSRATFASGIYERATFARVISEFERAGLPSLAGGAFLDIGANIGTATCLALSRYGATHAWAFEPAPENVLLLRQNLLANGFADRVSVCSCAVSDRPGVVTVGLSDMNWGDHRVRTVTETPEQQAADEIDRSTIQVSAVRLDDLINDGDIDLGSVRLAWIDTQGHEAHVLEGAKKLLSSDVPIVCEFWPYGLRRSGGLERLNAIVADGRSTFIDLGRPEGRRESTTKLAELALRHKGTSFTDILLLPNCARIIE